MKLSSDLRIPRAQNLHFKLDIDAQGITAVFGKSGCGKTSLLRALVGLEKNSGSTLEVNGKVWQNQSVFIPTHQRPLAYVFQEANLFSHLSVQGNIDYGLKRTPDSRRKIAVEKIIELLELDSLLNRKVDLLSGGERQRVAIARALAISPEILLMDEPLASLDQERKDELISYITSLNKELHIPIIYVSHSTEEIARLADQLIFIEDACIKAAGPIDKLLTRPDLSLAHRKQAESLIFAEAHGYDGQFQLNHLRSAIGNFTVPGQEIPTGKAVRLRLAAQDISLTLNAQQDTSILNILPALIADIMPEDKAQATVRLEINEHSVLARITRKSVDTLQLQAGKKVFAQIKSVAVLA